jgi:hypothetical protein
MSEWTHRKYFTRFRLNVEQYGEILIAQAFDGAKKGDAQRCFDVETTKDKMIAPLVEAGLSKRDSSACLSGLHGGTVRIEVKSKLSHTPTGVANVIHCSDNKLFGVGNYPPATHLAVILISDPENGKIVNAWIFSRKVAEGLRTQDTKSHYISVSSVKQAATARSGVWDISPLLNRVADAPLSMHSLPR